LKQDKTKQLNWKQPMLRECRSEKDLDQIIADSADKAVLLLKHSTACPISRGAWQKFNAFSEEDSRVECWQLMVRENKDLSQKIAELTGVEHKSPQVILFHKGKAIFNCSHYAINARVLGKQLDEIKP
jgi:bacillithiol system protein YtxJ